MSIWSALMTACYVVALGLWVTGVVRVRGDYWETSGRWMTAGWSAYGIGCVFFLVGLSA